MEYPAPDHPARKVSEAHKRRFQERLVSMAQEMGARDPQALGDGLLLLFEGVFVSGQLFGPDGPARSVAAVAAALIDASCGRNPA